MNKLLANKDITYCSNENCKQRKDCFRNLDNYFYNEDDLYWFSNFSEEHCIKRYAKENIIKNE